jgi:hypothetical protein
MLAVSIGGDFGAAKMNPHNAGENMLSDILIEAEAPCRFCDDNVSAAR